MNLSFKTLFFSLLSFLSLTRYSYSVDSKTMLDLTRELILLQNTKNKSATEIRKLIQKLEDLYNQDTKGTSLMSWAISNHNKELINILLEHGSYFDQTAINLAFLSDPHGLGMLILDSAFNQSTTTNSNPTTPPAKRTKTILSSSIDQFISGIENEDEQLILQALPFISTCRFNATVLQAAAAYKRELVVFLLQQPASSADLLTKLLHEAKDGILLMDNKLIKELLALPYFNTFHLMSLFEYFILNNRIKAIDYLACVKPLEQIDVYYLLNYACEHAKLECIEHIAQMSKSSELVEKAFINYYTTGLYGQETAKQVTSLLLKLGVSHQTRVDALGLALVKQDERAIQELLKLGATIEAVAPKLFSQALQLALNKNSTQSNTSQFIEKLLSYTTQLVVLPQKIKDDLLVHGFKQANALITKQALACGAQQAAIQDYLASFIASNNHDGFNMLLESTSISLSAISFHNHKAFIDKALKRAATLGLRKATALLLEFGADIHCADLRGVTDAPLKMAAGAGHQDVVEYLIAQGAAPDAFDDALKNAATNGHTSTVKALLHHGASLTNMAALKNALKNGHVSTVRRLLSLRQQCFEAAFSVTDKNTATLTKLLHNFDSDNHRALLEIIKAHSTAQTEQEKLTYLTVIKQLALDISGNLQDTNGNTALHLAILYNNPELIKELLALGAQPTIKNWQEQTPFDMAQALGRWDCVKVFVQAYCTQ